MKYTILFLLICYTTGSAFSQQATISATKQNILYININNPIDAVVENISCDSIWITTDNGSIIKHDRCSFFITPNKIGKATIYIHTIIDMDTVVINTFLFKVIEIKPSASLAGESGGLISKQQLNALNRLNPYFEGIVCPSPKVTYYKVILMHGNDVLQVFEIFDNTFSPEMKTAISALQKNDQIIFSSIKSTFNSKERDINSIEFTIK